jgi:hypothetical protein
MMMMMLVKAPTSQNRRNFRYPPELPPIYRKPPDTKKLSNTPPELPISLA